MSGLIWVLLAAAIGSMLAYRFGGLRGFAPRWAAWLLIAGTGTASGIGLTSVIFFVCRLAVPRFPALPMLVEFLLAAWLGFEIYRTRQRVVASVEGKSFPWNPLLGAALLVVLAAGTLAMTSFWEANPQGNWDAWAIWNLRARFLAAGGNLPVRAWSPLLRASHPEYPLLVSGFVARCWSYSGTASSAVPIATSFVLFLALVAIGTGGMAALAGGSLGLLFGLAAASSPFLLHEVPAQYADVPLACFFVGALVLMLLERPVGAGLLASLAAWTKDEGMLFLAAFLAVMAITRRRQLLPAIAAAIPVGTVVAFYRIFLTHGASLYLAKSAPGASLGRKLADSGRYVTVVGAAIEKVWDMGFGWYHPLLPVIVLCVLLRCKTSWRRDVMPAGILTGAMMIGYFFIYIITPADLSWQLETSLDRLAVQIWPLLLITVFAALRAPEAMAVAAAESPAVKPRGDRKRRG